ncbi:MAG: DUF4388 domain-containing protein [Acidobacteriota bacterium]
MSLSGRLEDITLPHFLQVIASHRLSGKLSVRLAEGFGLLVLRHGQVIYGATHSAREAFGSILLMRRLIDRSTLEEALVRQSQSPEEIRLGTVLVEMAAIDEETVRSVLREQIEKVLEEMFGWRRGVFKFESMDIPARGEVAVDVVDFLVREGLPTDELVDQALARIDEMKDQAHRATLGKILEDTPPPEVTGELVSRLLVAGRELCDSVLLLERAGRELRGVGHSGLPNGDLWVRDLRISLDELSVFARVVADGRPERGEVGLPRDLAGPLGEERLDALVVPLMLRSRPALVFLGYGLATTDDAETLSEALSAALDSTAHAGS